MAGVAASGGYYIAAGASKIVAHPATLTGSIGVVFALPNVRRLLEKLGIHTETLTRGRYASLFTPVHAWSPEERQQVQRLTRQLYRVFIRRVAQGRGLSLEEVDRLGRGRVWTGAQAHERGLVDELGGMAVALRLAKEAGGIPVTQPVRLVFFPQPRNLLQVLVHRLRGRAAVASRLPQALQRLVEQYAPLLGQQPGPLFVMPLHFRFR